ncbi:transposase [Paraburkholderia sp. UCT70]
MEIDILGIDLAKQVFQLHGADRHGRVVHRAKVSRGSLFESVRTLKPGLVVMEACSSAHHWARRFQSLGTEVRLISPQYVAPFVAAVVPIPVQSFDDVDLRDKAEVSLRGVDT